MQDLYCSISGELPQIPVKTPCNHIFDRDSIVQWLRTKASTTRACPFRCEQQFGLNDLRYAPEHLRKIIDIAKEQISILTSSQQLESKEQAESKEQMESQVIIEGLTMILKDGILVSNEVLLQSAQNEARLARIHKLSKEEFRNAMDEFYDNQEFS